MDKFTPLKTEISSNIESQNNLFQDLATTFDKLVTSSTKLIINKQIKAKRDAVYLQWRHIYEDYTTYKSITLANGIKFYSEINGIMEDLENRFGRYFNQQQTMRQDFLLNKEKELSLKDNEKMREQVQRLNIKPSSTSSSTPLSSTHLTQRRNLDSFMPKFGAQVSNCGLYPILSNNLPFGDDADNKIDYKTMKVPNQSTMKNYGVGGNTQHIQAEHSRERLEKQSQYQHSNNLGLGGNTATYPSYQEYQESKMMNQYPNSYSNEQNNQASYSSKQSFESNHQYQDLNPANQQQQSLNLNNLDTLNPPYRMHQVQDSSPRQNQVYTQNQHQQQGNRVNMKPNETQQNNSQQSLSNNLNQTRQTNPSRFDLMD